MVTLRRAVATPVRMAGLSRTASEWSVVSTVTAVSISAQVLSVSTAGRATRWFACLRVPLRLLSFAASRVSACLLAI